MTPLTLVFHNHSKGRVVSSLIFESSSQIFLWILKPASTVSIDRFLETQVTQILSTNAEKLIIDTLIYSNSHLAEQYCMRSRLFRPLDPEIWIRILL